jgi:hypothetical protein
MRGVMVLVVGITACGGGDVSDVPDGPPGAADAPSPPDPDGAVPGIPDAAADGPISTGCEPAATAIAQEITTGVLTAVVRLDHDTRALIGWQLVHGGYASPTESEARATAQAATGHGAEGTLLGGDEIMWIFHQPAGDFGGVGVTSDTTGLAIFGGSTIWDGAGDITYPLSWRDPSEAGSGCARSVGGSQDGWDLVDGTPLGTTDVDLALAAVENTAIPEAMWRVGYVFHAVVLRYPRSVGELDPTTAEWIVLIDGGWLR